MSYEQRLKVWRASEDSEHAVSIVVRLADDEQGCIVAMKAAQQAAVFDDQKDDLLKGEWPIDYCVVDPGGQLWTVKVDRRTAPTYVAIAAEQHDPAAPLVHVLVHGQVACRDPRLSGVPAFWPEGQKWMSFTEFSTGTAPQGELCGLCKRRIVSVTGSVT